MNVSRSHETGSASLVIRPNRSLPVVGMVALFVALSTQAATIGVAFALAGAWMILPFAGLEILIAGLLCRWFYRHRDDCELVTIDLDRVQVVKRWGNGAAHHEFPRHWARVTLDRRAGGARLLIGSHGRFVALGEEINDSDRALVAQELKQLLRSQI